MQTLTSAGSRSIDLASTMIPLFEATDEDNGAGPATELRVWLNGDHNYVGLKLVGWTVDSEWEAKGQEKLSVDRLPRSGVALLECTLPGNNVCKFRMSMEWPFVSACARVHVRVVFKGCALMSCVHAGAVVSSC